MADMPDNQNDLSTQYQAILDQYAKELKSLEAVPPGKPETNGTNDAAPILTDISAASAEELKPVSNTQDSNTPELPLQSNEPTIPPKANPAATPEPPPLSKLPPLIDTPTLAKSDKRPSPVVKFFFYISVLIFIGVIVMIGYTLLSSQDSPLTQHNYTAQPTVTSSPLPTAADSSQVCQANDQTFKIGETFPAADNCNTCTCFNDLTISCTEKTCEITPTAKPIKSDDLFNSVNKALKTKFKPTTADDGSRKMDLGAIDKAETAKVRSVLTTAGLVYDPSQSGENSTWQEIYISSSLKCYFVGSEGSVSLSCK